jgi:predicted metal-dependent HD superfamily phosphohydrolase
MLDQERFRQLWRRFNGESETDRLSVQLSEKYADPRRSYHNAQHIMECLKHLDRVREMLEHPDEVEVALWFHDVIYDSRSKTNEADSANWAALELTRAGTPLELITRIESLIMITCHAATPATTDEQYMLDIDLAILGASKEVFDQYDAAIRQEYDWVPESDYRAGRSAILKRFLDQPAIYHTPYFRNNFEHQARMNLQRAIKALQQD